MKGYIVFSLKKYIDLPQNYDTAYDVCERLVFTHLIDEGWDKLDYESCLEKVVRYINFEKYDCKDQIGNGKKWSWYVNRCNSLEYDLFYDKRKDLITMDGIVLSGVVSRDDESFNDWMDLNKQVKPESYWDDEKDLTAERDRIVSNMTDDAKNKIHELRSLRKFMAPISRQHTVLSEMQRFYTSILNHMHDSEEVKRKNPYLLVRMYADDLKTEFYTTIEKYKS